MDMTSQHAQQRNNNYNMQQRVFHPIVHSLTNYDLLFHSVCSLSCPLLRMLGSKDQKDLDRTINELRDRLQERTRDLNRLEGKKSSPAPRVPLSRSERNALSDLLPTTTTVELQP